MMQSKTSLRGNFLKVFALDELRKFAYISLGSKAATMSRSDLVPYLKRNWNDSIHDAVEARLLSVKD